MADPILLEIRDAMYDILTSMTVLAGYNYDWGECLDPDLAHAETFPASDIKIVSEENVDPINGTCAGLYSNEVTFEITTWGKLDSESTLPYKDAFGVMAKMLDDLKKAFGTYFTCNDTCEVIMYRRAEPIIQPQGDRFIPQRLVTRWLVIYTQDRQSPLVPA